MVAVVAEVLEPGTIHGATMAAKVAVAAAILVLTLLLMEHIRERQLRALQVQVVVVALDKLADRGLLS
jgi:hypothetical protein